MKNCKNCGAALPDSAQACPECGASAETVLTKVKRFEKTHRVIFNGLTAALALVFILVALLCPVKIASTGFDDIVGVGDEVQTPSISQTIWQVFEAFGYTDLDINDEKDRVKLLAIVDEYGAASEKAATELAEWVENYNKIDSADVSNRTEAYLQWLTDNPDAGNAEFKDRTDAFKTWLDGNVAEEQRAKINASIESLQTDLNLYSSVAVMSFNQTAKMLLDWMEQTPDASSAVIALNIQSIAQSLIGYVDAFKESVKDRADEFSAWVNAGKTEFGEDVYKKLKEYSAWISGNIGAYGKATVDRTKSFANALDGIYEKYFNAMIAKSNALTQKYMSDVNILAFTLAITTTDITDIIGDESEGAIGTMGNFVKDLMQLQRNEAMLAVIMELLAIIVRFGVAVLSLVYLILAIIAMAKKRELGVFSFMTAALLLSGIGFIIQTITPIFDSIDALFIMAVSTAIAYLGAAAFKAVVDGKNTMCIIKRAVCASAAIVAFFMLGAQMLGVIGEFYDETASVKLNASLGDVLTIPLICLGLRSITIEHLTISFKFASASSAGAVTALVLGALAMLVLLIAVCRELGFTANSTERTAKVNAVMIIAIAMLVLFAAVPAIIGAASAVPVGTELTPGLDGVSYSMTFGVLYKFAARWNAYVSLGFIVAAFVTELAWRIKLPEPTVGPAVHKYGNM